MEAGKSEFRMKKPEWISKYLTEPELGRIQQALDEVEKNTSGEIVLSLHEKLNLWEKLYDRHELALKDFNKLGIANTKYRTGILVYIVFKEKYYEILADEGIYKKIPDEYWSEIESELTEFFRNGSYAEGILTLIHKVEQILKKEFPAGDSTEDEISDEIKLK